MIKLKKKGQKKSRENKIIRKNRWLLLHSVIQMLRKKKESNNTCSVIILDNMTVTQTEFFTGKSRTKKYSCLSLWQIVLSKIKMIIKMVKLLTKH